MQVAAANLAAMIYLVLQLQAMPYRDTFDNYLALSCSLSLSVMLLCTIFYKYVSFTELPTIVERMSIEQRTDYAVAGLLLTVIFIVCVFGALVLSAALLGIQVAKDRRDRLAQRRLRFLDSKEAVQVTLLPNGEYHVFLSHAWVTGQDQMRVVKQRLLEMLPGVRVFLDVDDLQRKVGKGAELLSRSRAMLLFCSDGFFWLALLAHLGPVGWHPLYEIRA